MKSRLIASVTQTIVRTIILPMIVSVSLILVFFSNPAFAKSKNVRKVQEVNFAEVDLKGTVRNPDGAYLVQKRGLKFMPLYEVQKDMDLKIRESVQYIR